MSNTATGLVHQHLLRCAEDFARRAAVPRVAWDAIGAEAWSGACRKLASAVAGMPDEAAIAHLKAVRDGVPEQPETGTGRLPGWYMTMDFQSRMDEIIDPVARDRRGWIEITTHGGLDDGVSSVRPGYRRMLGINQCVAFCGRERGESDAAWLARRAKWLAQYHPDVWCVRTSAWSPDRLQCTLIAGTVETFITEPHLVETYAESGYTTRQAA